MSRKPLGLSKREVAANIIRHVLNSTRAMTADGTNAELRKSYPWGELVGWDYRLWREEVLKQWNDGKRVRRKAHAQPDLFEGS